ncbi:hypothetical protein [Lysobacter solisilvae (ex Woo and Kim 2020)]|uniref:Uncharacterized protein n=1 Tax=Agrilutibacter terrestris TaxID=2865112 RepID=A0A7H0G135_9GAMM|nr:hypothetical protein [Lysobacter terrestris]QNP42001.1 hypothetical protein H8B22_07350 [Lysobacter terrestris]
MRRGGWVVKASAGPRVAFRFGVDRVSIRLLATRTPSARLARKLPRAC